MYKCYSTGHRNRTLVRNLETNEVVFHVKVDKPPPKIPSALTVDYYDLYAEPNPARL